MTKDEVLIAINELYNAKVIVGADNWQVRVLTIPERQIVFGADFVEKNFVSNIMNKEMLIEYVKQIPESHWVPDPGGTLWVSPKNY